MGREIKRVALDFDWPLDTRWRGFLPPDDGTEECPDCHMPGYNHSVGYNRLGRRLYSLTHYDVSPALFPNTESLTDFDKLFLQKLAEKKCPEKLKGNNVPFQIGGISTVIDSRMVMYHFMHFIAESLGLPEDSFLCETCKGDGRVVVDEHLHRLYEEWEQEEPPEGEGWQVWETVSEGSPITPVFATAEELVDHLCTVGTVWDQKRMRESWGRDHRLPSREAAEAFVKDGWVPSMVISEGKVHVGIDAALAMSTKDS